MSRLTVLIVATFVVAVVFGVLQHKRQMAEIEKTIQHTEQFLKEKKEQEEKGWTMTRTQARTSAFTNIHVDATLDHPDIEVLTFELQMGQRSLNHLPEPVLKAAFYNLNDRDLVHLEIVFQFLDSSHDITSKSVVPINNINRIKAVSGQEFNVFIGDVAPQDWEGKANIRIGEIRFSDD